MILFLWVALYGLIFYFAELLSKLIQIQHSITSIAIFVYAICLGVYGLKNKYNRLCFKLRIQCKPRDVFHFLPLTCFLLANIFLVAHFFSAYAALLIVGVCVVEEIFFRGFLLNILNKKWDKYGVLVQAICFSLLHIVNYIDNKDLTLTILQIISAFTVGLSFGVITLKFNSLIPAIIAHVIINLTALGIVNNSGWEYSITMLVCSAINVVYALIYILKDKNRRSDI